MAFRLWSLFHYKSFPTENAYNQVLSWRHLLSQQTVKWKHFTSNLASPFVFLFSDDILLSQNYHPQVSAATDISRTPSLISRIKLFTHSSLSATINSVESDFVRVETDQQCGLCEALPLCAVGHPTLFYRFGGSTVAVLPEGDGIAAVAAAAAVDWSNAPKFYSVLLYLLLLCFEVRLAVFYPCIWTAPCGGAETLLLTIEFTMPMLSFPLPMPLFLLLTAVVVLLKRVLKWSGEEFGQLRLSVEGRSCPKSCWVAMDTSCSPSSWQKKVSQRAWSHSFVTTYSQAVARFPYSYVCVRIHSICCLLLTKCFSLNQDTSWGH